MAVVQRVVLRFPMICSRLNAPCAWLAEARRLCARSMLLIASTDSPTDSVGRPSLFPMAARNDRAALYLRDRLACIHASKADRLLLKLNACRFVKTWCIRPFSEAKGKSSEGSCKSKMSFFSSLVGRELASTKTSMNNVEKRVKDDVVDKGSRHILANLET